MLIGVISDTHIPNRAKSIPKEIFHGFSKVDMIIHAGDICEEYVLDDLELIAPVKAVAGNMDSWDLHKKIPRKQILDIKGYRIGIIHGDGDKGTTTQRVLDAFKDDKVNCIVFGHSHQVFNSLNGDILLFNPGSPTDKRKSQYFSYGLLQIGDTIEAKIVYF